MYVSSVMRFILFDSVLAKECHIRRAGAGGKDPVSAFSCGNCFNLRDVRQV